MKKKRRLHGSLTVELVTRVAKEHDTRSNFCREEYGCYLFAKKNGILEDICAHMNTRKPRKLSKEFVMALAKQYKTRGEFQRKDPSGYNYARQHNFFEEACTHMPINALIDRAQQSEDNNDLSVRFG